MSESDSYFFTPSFEPTKEENNIFNINNDSKAPASPRRGKRDKKSRQEREKEKEERELLEHLVIVGYESKLFRDDGTAKAVDAGHYLIPWMGDKSLLVDRYDVRLLVDDRNVFKVENRRRRTKEEKEEEEALNYERYFDIEHAEAALAEERCFWSFYRRLYSITRDNGLLFVHVPIKRKQRKDSKLPQIPQHFTT
eukprot:TRINITY_DN28359_c0_g1_i1.p1 TRINITY_DN28359_c0_g1~~TRINITY_DN28359_c0_g1_i1.p1  ORF type:complete len:195 (+),score=15.37 TRINITY_DN28359_c0_g1_i1:39-623(+)